MQVIVLAGGLGSRMRPLTEEVPKSMLKVAGRPFIDWQLTRLAACGFSDVVLCVAHLAKQIEAHVADGARFGLRVRYSHEGSTLLGTAGALRHAVGLLHPVFLVTYGDSYLPFDYADPLRTLLAHSDCDGVMSVYRNAGRWDASNVETDGDWVIRYEKGSSEPAFDHIDYGAIALRRDTIARVPAGQCCGLDRVQRELASQRRLRAFCAKERFYEIGSPAGLAALTRFLSP